MTSIASSVSRTPQVNAEDLEGHGRTHGEHGRAEHQACQDAAVPRACHRL